MYEKQTRFSVATSWYVTWYKSFASSHEALSCSRRGGTINRNEQVGAFLYLFFLNSCVCHQKSYVVTYNLVVAPWGVVMYSAMVTPWGVVMYRPMVTPWDVVMYCVVMLFAVAVYFAKKKTTIESKERCCFV